MYPTESKFPVALQDFGVDDLTPAFKDSHYFRLQLRFDTNGLIFSDFNIAGNKGEGRLFVVERSLGYLTNAFLTGLLYCI
jgi:hypothetical protein